MSLISCQSALHVVAEKIALLRDAPRRQHDELIALDQSLSRVLAQNVVADRDQPPFPRSTRDGYAVRAPDTGTRKVIGTIRAGDVWRGDALQAGEAVEIMTGAPVPAGADAVVMLEHVDAADDSITFHVECAVKTGENIVPRGQEARAGDVLLHSGVRMTPAEIALVATVGASSLRVYGKPRVAILSTGDELVRVDERPATHQIRNSSAHMLAAMVRDNGGEPIVLDVASDICESLRERIASSHDAEMLLMTGGVSVGKYDLVKKVLQEFGAEFFFAGVMMQPGKPVVFARIAANEMRQEQWIFGLPGNPVSTQVTALLFAMPMLRALAGEVNAQPRFMLAELTEMVKVHAGLTRFLPACLRSSLHSVEVKLSGWKSSGDLNGNARANCYMVVPEDVEILTPGMLVKVLVR